MFNDINEVEFFIESTSISIPSSPILFLVKLMHAILSLVDNIFEINFIELIPR